MKILVVEDEPGSRRLVKTVLTAAGYEVVEAADGQEAWEFFQREPFQLIVTD
ncbi:MAG: response regulator, partial [Chloroflexi bacterium]|nr:response regulator [Chloroflexota bacterium]